MLIVDSGPLVAAAATRDRNHERCVDLLSKAEGPLLVPTLVVTEVAYFLADRIGTAAERAFANALRGGELLCEPVDPADWSRIVQVLDEYADAEIGIVDASVLATCERLGQTKLATLDRRQFSLLRPRHCQALTLLPG